MSRTTKRFLSILLAAAMILSLGITGWAIDDITIVDPEKPAKQTDEHVTAGFEGGTDLELKEIDPSTLNVPRLGEIEEEDDTLESEDLPFGLNDIVRVSIVLDSTATMSAGYATQDIAANRSAMNYRNTLRQQQANVEAAIAAAGISMNVKWNLTLAVNIISAEVRYADIENIEAIPGVKAVWLETRYEPQVDQINTAITTEHMVGAVEVWNSGYTGAGTKVAIIDTGTNQDHLSFDPEALEFALDQDGLTPDLLTWDDIRTVADKLNVTVTEEVYKNTKIPYAYNYIDGGYITDHDSDDQGEHGSHVSGIAAANRYVKVDGEYVDAAQAVYAVGVAPDAQILTMKVFGKGGGAYDSDYMAAIEDAIILGADSVNLSLGSGSPGFSFSNGYQDVMDSLIECGTVVSISAGNSYNWADFLPSGFPYLYLEDVGLHTGGSPGSFVNSLCVAAAENVGTIAAPLYFNGSQMVIYTETEGYGNAKISSIPGTYEYVLIDGPGVRPLTNAADDTGATAIGTANDAFAVLGSEVLKGKVAICYRGSSSFFVKANAAAAQGAAAVIIINNTDGVIRMNLSDYEYSVPVVSILKDDGDTIKARSTPVRDESDNVLYFTGSMEITEEIQTLVTTDREDATITDFSSWGAPGSLIMKPEITAPGGDIFSVNGMTDDGYEYMSGTSMAAPHITGMAALVGQYIRENNLEEVTGQNRRTLINSLLMSTASPMIVDGAYLSILQQGSGLGDTFAATQAKAYITMDKAACSGAADGKVKVELGQDAARKGVYTFTFNVNNFSDIDLVYGLYTDVFTQAPTYYKGNLYMLTDTMIFEPDADFTASYDFPHRPLSGHDVNLDGGTDRADVQALLDYLTGLVDGEELNLEAGEMDGREGISSFDAQLLLEWLVDNGIDQLVVPAGESVPVTVTITYSEDAKDFLDYYYSGGAYVEGFTYVYPYTETADGEYLDVRYSIPILGFYGSWTDASMFDCVSPIEKAYGSTKVSYTGNTNTNLLTINNGKGNTVFMGNPYVIEDEFPAERLAISPVTKLVNFKTNLIRNASTVGWLALDENNQVLKSGSLAGETYGAWYYVNGGSWQSTATTTTKLGTNVSGLGVKEGDVFTIGYFAIPELYGLMLHPGTTDTAVTADEIAGLLADGELGAGAYVGYTFTVDAKAPTAEAKLSDDGSKITVTAKDDNYIAYIGIMDVNGNVAFAGEVPEQSEAGEEVEVTFDISELDLPNGVAIFVGDYAANEVAYLIVFDPDQPIIATKTIWKLTDKLTTDTDYIIATSNEAGAAFALNSQGVDSYTGSVGVKIVTDDLGTYIDASAVADSFVWTTQEEGDDESGYYFTNKDDGGVLGWDDFRGPYVSWSNPAYADAFLYQNNCLLYQPYADYGYGMAFSSPNFIFYAATPVYLYTPVTLEIELDPTQASEVKVTPETATLIVDVMPTVELLATVEPIVLPDCTVTWSSSDETIATVNAEGLVTAVGPGIVTITATSNKTPEVFGTATITVVESEPMDAVVYGQVAFGNDDIEYGAIDLNDMSVTDLSDNAMFSAFYGGGRSGDYIYGNDIDNDFHRYNAEDNYAYDGDYYFAINPTWALIDIGCFPGFSVLSDGETYDYNYILTGFNSTNNLCYFDEEGGLKHFDLSDIGEFVAVAFVGADIDPAEDTIEYYYLLLAEDGSLYIWIVSPKLPDGTLSAQYDVFANIGMLPFGEDKTAYSMSYYGTEEEMGVFIADNSTGGIYYVDLNKRDDDGNVDAQFIGKIKGATNLSSLSDFDFDTHGPIGTIVFGAEGDSIGLPKANEAFRSIIRTGEVLQAETGTYRDTDADRPETKEPDYDIVTIDPVDDVEIITVGGLDAVSTQAAPKPDVKLDSAVWGNPDTYETEGVYVMLTTPNYEPVPYELSSVDGRVSLNSVFTTEQPDSASLYEDVYNGLTTLTYDPEVLTFDSFVPHYGLEMKSFSVDEENGVIKFAFASGKCVPEGVIGVVHFTTPVEDTEIEITMDEFNANLTIDEYSLIEIKGKGYTITIDDRTNGGATTSIDETAKYRDEVEFTVNADQAVLVAVKDSKGYTRLWVQGAGDDGYIFKVNVKEDITIALVYKGDASLNGKVETKDGTIIKRFVVDSYTFKDPLGKLASDVNGNGKVETKDATMVARQVVGTHEIQW